MKKKILLAMIVAMMGLLCACKAVGDSDEANAVKPEEEQIRAICELSTLECYYHNVAKSIKTKGTGITSWGEKDREFWIEYTGVAKIGIDMSKVKMIMDDENHITIYLPEAEVTSVTVKGETLDYISSADGWNKNEITAEDETDAIDKAQQEMEETVKANSALLQSARDRAQKLIENYINQLGKAVGATYEIEWSYDDASNMVESTQ
jgi:hypothetical protein